MVQNLDTKFSRLGFQTQNESPAIFIDHDLDQCLNSSSFVGSVGSVGNTLPQPLVIMEHGRFWEDLVNRWEELGEREGGG